MKELLADKLLMEYIERLEKENKDLREQLKNYRQPGFHKNIVKKGKS